MEPEPDKEQEVLGSGNWLAHSGLTDGTGVTGSSEAVVIDLSLSDALEAFSPVCAIDPQLETYVNSVHDNMTWRQRHCSAK